MKEGVFEFKGVMYERYEDKTYGFGTGIRRVGETPNFNTHNISEEIIPEHLKRLNKRQLRQRILVLETLAKEQGKLLKEFEKDRIV